MSLKSVAFWFIIVNGLNFGVNFAFAPYLTRALSLEENGSYGQILLICNLLIMIFSLGISNVYQMLIAESRNEVNKIFYCVHFTLVFSSIIAIIIQCIIGYFSYAIIGNSLCQELFLFIPYTLFSIISSVLILHLIYLQKTKELMAITVAINFFKVILSVYFINIIHSFQGFLMIVSLVPLVSFVGFIYLIPHDDKKLVKVDYNIVKGVLNSSYPFFIIGLIGYFILVLDGWMVGKLLSVKDYAIYRNGAIEIPFVASIYGSISTVILSRLAILNSENKFKEMFRMKKESSRLNAILIYPIVVFLMVNADYIIPMYLSDKYRLSATVFAIYSIAVLVRINDYLDLLILKKSRRVILIVFSFIFIFNLVINYFLIQFMGSNGAALSYSLSIFLLALILIIITCKMYDMKITDYIDIKSKLVLLLVCFISSLFIKGFATSSFSLFCLISLLYFIILYLLFIRYNFINESIIPNRFKWIYNFVRHA